MPSSQKSLANDANKTLPDSRFVTVLLGCITMLSAVAVDISLPTMPVMVEALNSDSNTVQFIVTVYMFGMGLGQLFWGFLADRYGRLPVIYIGFGGFAVVSLVCALAQSIESILALRFVQGVLGAVGPIIGRTIVRDAYSGVQAAAMLATVTAILGAAPLLAPLIGSALIAFLDWRAVFVFLCLFAVVVAIMTWRYMPETLHPAYRQTLAPKTLWVNAKRFLNIPQCRVAVGLATFALAATFQVVTQAAVLLHEVYGVAPQHFGFIFALGAMVFIAGSLTNKRWVPRLGVLGMVRFGSRLMLVAGALLSVFVFISHVPLWVFWPVLLLMMYAVGVIAPNATVLALDPVPEIAGSSASVLGFVQIGGGAFIASIVAHYYSGDHRVLCLGLVSMCALVGLVYWRGRKHLGSFDQRL